MTLITGTIKDSGGAALSGFLRVTLDAPLVDSSTAPDSLHVAETKDFPITAGAISISLPQSQTSELTYFFEFFSESTVTNYYFADGGLYPGPRHFWTDSNWYTGAVHTANSSLLFQQVETRSKSVSSFHAIVPNVASCEFASLLPTGITTDVLDTSLRRVAELLVFTQAYAVLLRGGPRWKGDYVATTFYQLDDGVQYAGSSWIYINPDPAAGQTPSSTNTTYWMCSAKKGDPGGTGGTDIPYDAIGWDGATWAPSANAVRDIIELLARANNAALTGNPTAPTQAVGNNSTRLASTAFVIAEIISRFTNTNLLGVPTCPTPLLPDNSGAIANTNFVKSVFHRYIRLIELQPVNTHAGAAIAGIQTRMLNTIADNTAGDLLALNATNGRFTLRPGTYRIHASSPAFSVGSNRISLFNGGTGTRILSGKSTHSASSNSSSFTTPLHGRFTISVNTDLEIRHFCQLAVSTWGLGIAVNDGVPEVYTEVEIWRLD
jgi:hypothetical protein